jgi:hypothetical protein
MPDITTTQIFSDGEKGITATKMNNIIANSVIQPDFVTTKPSSSTLDPTDQLLEVKGAGTYARITGSQLISSVSAQVDATPQIYSVRLRSFNGVGNPTFECTQRNIGNLLTNPAHTSFIEDRWIAYNAGSLNPIFQVANLTAGKNVPGTSFAITRAYMRMIVGTVKSSLAAGDVFGIGTQIEGPMWRELQNDVHSLSLLLRSTVNCKLGVSLRDAGTTTNSLTKLVTLVANTDTLVQLPNLPVWPAGNFTNAPGSASYQLAIMLACGSTYMSPANDTWQSGVFLGAVGQDNFLANPVNSEVDVFFVQHEPGAVCTTPMDCPFTQNYADCLRYYGKSYDYGVKAGTNVGGAGPVFTVPTAVTYAVGNAPFPKHMAKAPAVSVYANDGTLNAASVFGGSTVSVSTVYSDSRRIFQLLLAAGQSLGAGIVFNYTADTGW